MPDRRKLRRDAIAIWQAGVDAVRSETLVGKAVQRNGETLMICDNDFRLPEWKRIAVVGAGKAGAGMAAAIEEILGSDLLDEKVTGWINVPADCVRPLAKIQLHPARPAGVNEPTEEGLRGSLQILEIVEGLGPQDLCIVLISGGGSALLPAPIEGLKLADELAVTRFLMNSGATITELNAVRKRLSRIKGGRLARAIRAGRTETLIISDVVGDPLDVIASGPTVPDPTTNADALAILEKYHANPPSVPHTIWDALSHPAAQSEQSMPFPASVRNHIIGNNATAIDAAHAKAVRLGYDVKSQGSANQGEASQVGRDLANWCRAARKRDSASKKGQCVLSGGEPVVHLAKTDRPRKGGRNQQLVLAALDELWEDGMDRIALLSGGTDGEDGPTDAAGAVANAALCEAAHQANCAPQPFLEINDAYTFFEKFDGLLKTGPTHTNVMDLRVGLVAAKDR